MFRAGDVIAVTAKDGEWWTGLLGARVGIFPANYVTAKEERTISPKIERTASPQVERTASPKVKRSLLVLLSVCYMCRSRFSTFSSHFSYSLTARPHVSHFRCLVNTVRFL